MWQNNTLLEKESFLYLIFISLIIQDLSYKKYLLVLFILALGMYLISGNIIKAIWLSFISAFLFNYSYDLIINYELPKNLISLLKPVNYVYSLVLADLFLIPLIYFLKRKPNKLRGEGKYRFGLKDILLLLIIICGLISTLIASVHNIYAWYSFFVFIKYIIIFYLAILICSDKENIKPTLEIIILFGFFSAILIILQKFHGGPLGWAVENSFSRYADEMKSLFRPGGTSWNANLTGSILVMLAPFTLVFGSIKSKFNKKLMRLIFGTITLAIIFTASRFVWIIFATSLMTIFFKDKSIYNWLTNYFQSINRYLKFGVLGILIIVLLPFITGRMLSFENSLGFEYRLNHYVLSYDLLLKNPLGIGFDMFKYKIINTYKPKEYMYDSSPQHNLFLEMATGTGIVGGFLFIFWTYLTIREKILIFLKKQSSWPETLLALTIIIYFAVNQMYSSLFSVTITELFWLILGISYVEFNLKKI